MLWDFLRSRAAATRTHLGARGAVAVANTACTCGKSSELASRLEVEPADDGEGLGGRGAAALTSPGRCHSLKCFLKQATLHSVMVQPFPHAHCRPLAAGAAHRPQVASMTRRAVWAAPMVSLTYTVKGSLQFGGAGVGGWVDRTKNGAAAANPFGSTRQCSTGLKWTCDVASCSSILLRPLGVSVRFTADAHMWRCMHCATMVPIRRYACPSLLSSL